MVVGALRVAVAVVRGHVPEQEREQQRAKATADFVFISSDRMQRAPAIGLPAGKTSETARLSDVP